MTTIDAKTVMKLRQMTGAPMMDCKAALKETDGDMDKAKDVLRKKGMASAAKASSREVKEGKLFSYVHHNGKIAVLVEVVCETDFVAMNEEFNHFGANLCKTVAAFSPEYLNRESVDAAAIEKERQFVLEQTQESMKGKPENVIEKAVEGRMRKFFEEKCLIEKTFINSQDQSDTRKVEQARQDLVAKIGENIVIRRFTRMELGG